MLIYIGFQSILTQPPSRAHLIDRNFISFGIYFILILILHNYLFKSWSRFEYIYACYDRNPHYIHIDFEDEEGDLGEEQSGTDLRGEDKSSKSTTSTLLSARSQTSSTLWRHHGYSLFHNDCELSANNTLGDGNCRYYLQLRSAIKSIYI